MRAWPINCTRTRTGRWKRKSGRTLGQNPMAPGFQLEHIWSRVRAARCRQSSTPGMSAPRCTAHTADARGARPRRHRFQPARAGFGNRSATMTELSSVKMRRPSKRRSSPRMMRTRRSRCVAIYIIGHARAQQYVGQYQPCMVISKWSIHCTRTRKGGAKR